MKKQISFWVPILYLFLLSVFGIRVKAQTCGNSVVLDSYGCGWDERYQTCYHHNLGLQYEYSCTQSPCQTTGPVCSSDDAAYCTLINGNCDYTYCSPSPCFEDSSSGTNCGTETCDPCQRCAKVDETCVGPLCERKCVGGQCPPAPTPVPNRPPICGAITGPTSICRGQTYQYTSSCSDPDFNLAQVDFAWAPVTTGGWTAMGSCNPTNGACTQDLFVDPAKFAVGSNYYVVNGAADSGTPALKCSANPFITSWPSGEYTYCGPAVVTAAVIDVTAAPTNLTVSGECTNYAFSWNAVAGATSYKVYEVSSSGYVLAGNSNTTSLNLNLPNCGSVTDYVVRAVNGCGESANSNPVTVTVKCVPSKPTNTSISCSGGYQVVNWTDTSNNETGFQLSRVASWPDTNKNTGSNVQLYKDDVDPGKAILGTAYSYSVRAVNSSNPDACKYSDWVPAGLLACYGSWFQVSGGDVVAANGSVSQAIPASDYLDPSPGDFTGITFGEGSSINAGQANVNSWLVDITGHNWGDILRRHDTKYSSMKTKVSARVTPYSITRPSMNNTDFDTAVGANGGPNPLMGQKINEIHIWERVGNLNIEPSGWNVGTNKVLLFVSKSATENGNVTINGNITIGSGGMLTIMAEGNINIAGTVGDDNPNNDVLNNLTPANLQGIYYADKILTVETDSDNANPDEQLVVDGSLIGIGGVVLNRNSPGDNPSILVRFNPNYTDILRQVGLRKKVMRELL